jgi:hypothetical protein
LSVEAVHALDQACSCSQTSSGRRCASAVAAARMALALRQMVYLSV